MIHGQVVVKKHSTNPEAHALPAFFIFKIRATLLLCQSHEGKNTLP